MQSLIFYLAVSHQREAVNQQVQKLPITSDERSRTLPAEPVSPRIARSGSPQPHPPRSPSPHAGAPAGTQAGREGAPDKGVKREGGPEEGGTGGCSRPAGPSPRAGTGHAGERHRPPALLPAGSRKGREPRRCSGSASYPKPPPNHSTHPPPACSPNPSGPTAPPGLPRTLPRSAGADKGPISNHSVPVPASPSWETRNWEPPRQRSSPTQRAQSQTRSFGEPLPSSCPLRF